MIAKITAQKNASYKVEGPVQVFDSEGNLLKEKGEGEQTFLCRCGHSQTKPFCDGSHKTCGFAAP